MRILTGLGAPGVGAQTSMAGMGQSVEEGHQVVGVQAYVGTVDGGGSLGVAATAGLVGDCDAESRGDFAEGRRLRSCVVR